MAKTLRGTIVSDKMDKTAVVEVQRFFRHKRYGKFIKRNKRYKVHNEKNEYKVGDKVVIQECRPISRDKKFKVVAKIKPLATSH